MHPRADAVLNSDDAGLPAVDKGAFSATTNLGYLADGADALPRSQG